MLHKLFEKIAAIVNLHVKYILGLSWIIVISITVYERGTECSLATDLRLCAKVSSNYFYEAVNWEGTLLCEPWRWGWNNFWEMVIFYQRRRTLWVVEVKSLVTESSVCLVGVIVCFVVHNCGSNEWREQHKCVCLEGGGWMSTFFLFALNFVGTDKETPTASLQ